MSQASSDDGVRLLSLDGGGIRGLSQLYILETIMHRIMVEEDLPEVPRPCDYFDLIGGTSTGGITALMLGRLRLSIKDTIDLWENLATKVFSDAKTWKPGGDGLYKASKLEKSLQDVIQQHTGDANAPMLDRGAEGGRVCKTFVCAMRAQNMNASIPAILRTYESSQEVYTDCPIWKAARATSAAPTFFKRIKIGASIPVPYIDGGLGRNNPTAQVIEEAHNLFPNRRHACIISIGAGKINTISISMPTFLQTVVPTRVINAMVDIATDCEATAERMAKEYADIPNVYFRFNVEQGLQDIKAGQFNKMSDVHSHTTAHMKKYEVAQELGNAVAVIIGEQGTETHAQRMELTETNLR
ncbi:hypothetical protein PLICRDRAFT_698003 [Plicaturopsis crispa FD-325 SS-3]|nr:hypothetical protein PLICRDRAFT_698003 [Plicaturopsis crispa FD-325 SS-3]